MLNITLAQLKADIAPKMKGTSVNEIGDFYSLAAGAANRMLARIDTQETVRTVTMTTPFVDNVQDYALVADYKRMIDIRPQANRIDQPGRSHYGETQTRQFLENLTPDSFSIRWNSGVRSLRAQRLPAGNVITLDTFDSITANGTWSASVDASGLYIEPLNFIEGTGAMGFNLSGSTGVGLLQNSTAPVTDLSAYRYEDVSTFFVCIPAGYSSRFSSFTAYRGSSASNYRAATAYSKFDGTAFADGWNPVLIRWNDSSAVVLGTPDDTRNTFRAIQPNYSAGTAISGVLLDNWTDSFGELYEIEYYSEYMFRTAAGIWLQKPTLDTDLVNIGTNSYEILKAEMMVDITQEIRTGNVMSTQVAEWRLMLNGMPQTRYVKDPPYHGLYADYLKQFPSQAIPNVSRMYFFDC